MTTRVSLVDKKYAACSSMQAPRYKIYIGIKLSNLYHLAL